MKSKNTSSNDATAQVYDIVWGPFTNRTKTEREVKFVSRRIRAGGTILDLGCGTGRHLIPLARRGYRLVGIDNSRKMLDILRKKISAHMFPPRLIFGDLQRKIKLPLADGAICFWNAFCEMALTPAAAKRIFRAVNQSLKKPGMFLIETPNPLIMDLRAGEFRNSISRRGIKYDIRFWIKHYDVRRKILTAEEEVTIIRKGQVSIKLRAACRQKLWSARELKLLARQAGLAHQELRGDGFGRFSRGSSRHQIQVFSK